MGDLEKINVSKCLKSCPKSSKLPNLVTLVVTLSEGRFGSLLPTYSKLHVYLEYFNKTLTLPV